MKRFVFAATMLLLLHIAVSNTSVEAHGEHCLDEVHVSNKRFGHETPGLEHCWQVPSWVIARCTYLRMYADLGKGTCIRYDHSLPPINRDDSRLRTGIPITTTGMMRQPTHSIPYELTDDPSSPIRIFLEQCGYHIYFAGHNTASDGPCLLYGEDWSGVNPFTGRSVTIRSVEEGIRILTYHHHGEPFSLIIYKDHTLVYI